MEQNGEDGYFGCDNMLSVIDGVGGWIDHDVDPGMYAK